MNYLLFQPCAIISHRWNPVGHPSFAGHRKTDPKYLGMKDGQSTLDKQTSEMQQLGKQLSDARAELADVPQLRHELSSTQSRKHPGL